MKTYKHNGLNFCEFAADKLSFRWWDKVKNDVPKNSFNSGFFGYFSALGLKNYTLPVGNLVCDKRNINTQQATDIRSWGGAVSDKIKLTVNQNVSPQFKKKKVSTLIITEDNVPLVIDTESIPSNVKYAVSGVPVVRNKENVSWLNYVTKQGWKGDPMYATWRNWIGIKNDGTMILIWGSTSTGNYISTSEIFSKTKNLGIKDLLALDGGGSYINTISGVSKTSENRRINTIGIIAE
jgi:Predicted periplasmic protein (DUF2233).